MRGKRLASERASVPDNKETRSRRSGTASTTTTDTYVAAKCHEAISSSTASSLPLPRGCVDHKQAIKHAVALAHELTRNQLFPRSRSPDASAQYSLP